MRTSFRDVRNHRWTPPSVAGLNHRARRRLHLPPYWALNSVRTVERRPHTPATHEVRAEMPYDVACWSAPVRLNEAAPAQEPGAASHPKVLHRYRRASKMAINPITANARMKAR